MGGGGGRGFLQVTWESIIKGGRGEARAAVTRDTLEGLELTLAYNCCLLWFELQLFLTKDNYTVLESHTSLMSYMTLLNHYHTEGIKEIEVPKIVSLHGAFYMDGV